MRIMSGESMNKSTELFIGKLLKNWVGQHMPPANVRARLLWEASHNSQPEKKLLSLLLDPQFYRPPALRADERVQTFFIWVNETAFRSGLQARVI